MSMRKYGTFAGTLLGWKLNYRLNMKVYCQSNAFMMLAYPLDV
ncbi:MAG: hypothetical protein ABSG67_12100 [Thermoguttaceae bacterium]|jgi:hypothetical protein